MSDKKHIDRLFQERFKDFEATPDAEVWDAIHNTLHGKKKKRRLVPIWWRVGGVAAGLALLVTVGAVWFNENPEITPESNTTIVDTDIETNSNTATSNSHNASEVTTSKEDVLPNMVASEEPKGEEDSSTTNKSSNTLAGTTNTESILLKEVSKTQNSVNSNNNNNLVTETSSNTSYKKNRTAQISNDQDNYNYSNSNEKNTIRNETVIANKARQDSESNFSNRPNAIDKSKASKLIRNTKKGVAKLDNTQQVKTDTITRITEKPLEEKPSIFDEIDNKEDKVADTDVLKKRWNVMPNIAPVYYNTLGKGSSIHSQFSNNDKSGQVNMSYGIAASYAVSDKLSLRSGIHKVTVGYNTNNVYVYNGLETTAGGAGRSIETIDYTENAQTIAVITTANNSFSQVPEALGNALGTSLDQSLGFIEVPLELAYKVSDKKLGVSVIGGMSALFLSDNEISSTLNGNRTQLGEANNVRTTSFSANFGLGMDYKLSEKFNINLEPVFKYQMNTFESKSGDFKPFLIGVYTGVSFKF